MAINFKQLAEDLYRKQATAGETNPLATRLAQGLAGIWLTDERQRQIRSEEGRNLARKMGTIRERG